MEAGSEPRQDLMSDMIDPATERTRLSRRGLENVLSRPHIVETSHLPEISSAESASSCEVCGDLLYELLTIIRPFLSAHFRLNDPSAHLQ